MKVCFIGAGSIGCRHIKNLKTICPNVSITLFRNTNRELDESILNIVSKIIYDFDLLDEWYDAVFVTNPTHLHYEIIDKFNDKTDYFFIEKPVFDKMDVDVDALIKDNKLYYVACPLRYTKILNRAKEILKDEKVCSARAISSSYLPEWRLGVDYRKTYSAHREQGGGVRIDLIHEWDYLSSLFGIPDDVSCISGKFSSLEIDSEDLAIYIARYKDMTVELHLDYLGRYTQRYLEIFTNSVVYRFDIANSCIYKNGECVEKFTEQPNDKYIKEIEFFLDLMTGKESNTNDIRYALNVMNIANQGEE